MINDQKYITAEVSAQMNYYNRYPGDYSKDTQDLSLAEHGAFTLLLDHLYGTERVLPKNPVGLFRVCRAFTQDEQDAVMSVIRKFFIETEDGYTNTRFEAEQEKARARIDAARENGKKGGRGQSKPSGDSEKNPVGSQSATQEEPSGSALHTPYTIHHTTKDQNQKPETKKKKQTQAKPARFDPLAIPLPDCIKPSAWEAWIEYRKARKLTCAEQTIRSQLQNLEAWWNEGHEPNAIMQTSITSGWQGLFAPKLPFASKPVEDTSETNRRLAELVSRKFNLVGGQS